MWKLLIGRVNLRPAILVTLSSAMFLSLVYSLSLQHGHADVPVAKSAELVQPLQVGQSAPRFVVETVDNEPFIFDPRNLERPALIVTFRGGWCPYCNMHLSELRTVMPEIRDLGVDILFLSGDRSELIYRSLKQDTQEAISDLDYRILSDADANAAIALGIAFKVAENTINRRHEKGQDIVGSSMLRHGILSVPSIFAIDRGGTIAYAFVEPDYKVRLPAEDLLEVARKIVQ